MSERANVTETAFWADADDEVALRRYRTLVNTVDDGIYQLDASGRFVAVNDVIVEMTGYTREELLGEHVSIVLGDDDIERIGQKISQCLENGVQIEDTFEFAAQTVGGEIPCELQMSLLVEDGTFVGTVGIVRDITDRKQAERSLNEHQQQLERERDLTNQILDTSPIAIMVLDSDGEIVRLNDRAIELLEIDDSDSFSPAERTVYNEDGDPVPIDDRPYTRVLKTGEPVYDQIVRVELPSGDNCWLSVNATPVFDDDGEIDHVVTTGEDVTTLKERERSLKRRRDELATELNEIYGRITDGFIALDEEWRFTHINERAEEILGLDEDELLGANIWQTFPDVVGTAFEDHYRQAMETQEPLSLEEYYAPQDRWFIEHIYPSETGLSIYFRDVTERKRIESEFEKTIDRITDAFYSLDTDWNFTYINDRAAELIDLDDRGLVGKNVWEEFEWAANSKLREEYETALETQESTSFELYYPDPLDTWFEVHAYPSETGLSVYFQDITERKEREADLELFRNLIDHSNDSVFVIDPKTGRFLDVNDTACRHLGYDRPDLLELSVPDIEVEFPDHEAWQTHVENVRSEGGLTFEGKHQRADGTTLPVEVNVNYVELDREYMLAVVRDVTERRERERKLAESERRHRTLAECFPNGLVTLFDEELKYTLAAGRAFDDLPVDPSDVEGNYVWETWDEDTADALEPQLRAALEGEERSIELEYAGREWVIHAVPITDDSGDVFAGMTMAQDITERKENERQLRERERELEQYKEYTSDILDAIDDIFYVLDDTGSLKRWNESVATVTGYTDDEIETMHALDFFGEGDQESIANAIAEGFETGTTQVEANLATKEGNAIPYEFVANALENPDGNQVLVGIGRDITDREEKRRKLEETIEQLEASNERLEQFAYAASHDLQEPLRMVSTYLQLIERRYAAELDEDGREFLEFAVDGADRMREMIDALLEYSRVETSGDPFRPVDLEAIVADVLDDLTVQIEETNASITVEALPSVHGDASQLRQVFQNLLSNAIEYSGDEPPQIHIDAERRGRKWQISVRDNGIGIDAENQARIFEIFQRLHSRDEHAGTGIGLALCQRIVERHNGRIRVDSEPGDGATFSFTLPAAE